MWQDKIFETREQMLKWIDANDNKTQWQEIYINNAYGITYRKLRVM